LVFIPAMVSLFKPRFAVERAERRQQMAAEQEAQLRKNGEFNAKVG
jgi:hypothetical protein